MKLQLPIAFVGSPGAGGPESGKKPRNNKTSGPSSSRRERQKRLHHDRHRRSTGTGIVVEEYCGLQAAVGQSRPRSQELPTQDDPSDSDDEHVSMDKYHQE